MSEGVQVAVGQIWEDDDPRSSGRRIEITEVEEGRVRGRVIKVARNVSEEQVGRRTRWISVKRFRPGNRGYRLVENPATGTRVEG
jgi:hypothetical protein